MIQPKHLSARTFRTPAKVTVLVAGILAVVCVRFSTAQTQTTDLNWPRYGLVMEPKLNGADSNENDWPLTWFVQEPGQVFDYAVGYPRAPVHDVFNIVNDTDYTITGLVLHIVGPASETEDDNGQDVFFIDRNAKTDADFGDVDGDRQITSDIFKRVIISSDRKFIFFTDGEIKPGDHFTDISLSKLLKGKPKGTDDRIQLAGVESAIIADGRYGSGDLNGDKSVDQADHILALRLARGESYTEPYHLAAGDFNNTGRIEMSDVQAIRRLINP